MKALQIIHFAATLLLLVAMIILALFLGGVIEGPAPNKNRAIGPQAAEVGQGNTKFRLTVLRGLQPNAEYAIWPGQNFIGRADDKPADIDLTFQEIPERIWASRQHAVITCEDGALFIEDLNSANGTHVNRNRIPPGQKQPIQVNDVIQIGELHLKIQ